MEIFFTVFKDCILLIVMLFVLRGVVFKNTEILHIKLSSQ